jgi:hypothetical protein
MFQLKPPPSPTSDKRNSYGNINPFSNSITNSQADTYKSLKLTTTNSLNVDDKFISNNFQNRNNP